MINRFQFSANLDDSFIVHDCVDKAVQKDSVKVADYISTGKYMTIALYRHDSILYLYIESTENDICASELFPAVTQLLENSKGQCSGWQLMNNVYYTSVPMSEECWIRKEKKVRIGRIGRLMPDKIGSYVSFHKKLMEEGLLNGEKYLCIALYQNTLFLYSESPGEMVHLRTNSDEKSSVVHEWRRQNPKSHFDHEFSGEQNFVNLDEVFSLGREDVFCE